MRLEQFRLIKYGPFEDYALDLDPAPGKLNIVCAPNGAGKSVLRQAFGDLLFGIGGQTKMAFRYGFPGMRLCATAVTADGARHGFGRRKGHGNTWTDLDGNPLATPSVLPFFNRTDGATLERLFALDTERLRQGGEALLAEDGTIGETLLSGAGLFGTRKLRDELNQIAESLAPQRKSASRPYYVALENFSTARRAAAEALLRPEAWEKLVRQRDEAAARLATERARAAEASTAVARLERIRRVRAPLAAHDEAAAWLAAHADAPTLPPALGPRLADARARLDVARRQERAEAERLQELRLSHQAISVERALLAEAGDIELLAEKAGGVEQALTDIPKREAELAQLDSALAGKLRQLGADVALEDAASVIPPRAAAAQARQLIGQHEARVGALQAAEEGRAALARDMSARAAALSLLPAAEDTAALARLRDEIRAQGDPAAQWDAVQAALAQADAALESALAGVPGWQGSAAELASMSPLAATAYERGYAALAEANAAQARATETLAAARAQHDEAAQALAALRAGGDVPDRDAITAARAHRDEGYALIARKAFDGAPPSAAEIEAFAGMASLGLAYEQAVAKADRLADRQVEESGLVARAGEVARRLQAANTALTTAASAHEAARASAASARAAWQALLPAWMRPDAALDDVRTFLAARARVIERIETHATEAARAARLTERHAAWSASLAATLGAGNDALPGLLASATQRLDAAAQADKERTGLEAALGELRRRGAALEAAYAKAASALAHWEQEWAASLLALKRPAGEAPAVTADVLQLLDDLARDLDRKTAIVVRLAEMRHDTGQFGTAVRALAARLGVTAPADSRATLAAVRAQRERLTEQRGLESRLRTFGQQADQAAEKLAGLARAREHREAELAEAVAACGAPDAETAERVLAAAAARAANETALADANRTLLAQGDGLPLDILRAEAALVSADEVVPALEDARATAAAAQEAAQREAAEVALLNAGLEKLGSDTAYGEAIAAQGAAAATADRVLREALAARLAAALLARAMEAVEEQGGADMLARIGAWFRTITGGAYRTLASEPGPDGQNSLVAVPAERPDEVKTVDQLSEGTRDQLYLALRMEAVAAHGDALPFIADDILQTFDDTRARAALGALLELSERVQVIVLTHHRHVIELAADLGAERVHLCGL